MIFNQRLPAVRLVIFCRELWESYQSEESPRCGVITREIIHLNCVTRLTTTLPPCHVLGNGLISSSLTSERWESQSLFSWLTGFCCLKLSWNSTLGRSNLILHNKQNYNNAARFFLFFNPITRFQIESDTLDCLVLPYSHHCFHVLLVSPLFKFNMKLFLLQIWSNPTIFGLNSENSIKLKQYVKLYQNLDNNPRCVGVSYPSFLFGVLSLWHLLSSVSFIA